MPSGRYAFLVLKSEREEMTYLDEITILDINDLKGGGLKEEEE